MSEFIRYLFQRLFINDMRSTFQQSSDWPLERHLHLAWLLAAFHSSQHRQTLCTPGTWPLASVYYHLKLFEFDVRQGVMEIAR